MGTLRALPILGAVLTMLGLARPWQPDPSTSPAVVIGITVWVLLPLIGAALLHRHCQSPRRSNLLTMWLVCLSAIWCLGAVVALAHPEADLNLGLLFIPALEWIALFVLFVFWSIERTRADSR